MIRLRRRRGFSLLEMAIAALLLSLVILLAIALWQSARRLYHTEQTATTITNTALTLHQDFSLAAQNASAIDAVDGSALTLTERAIPSRIDVNLAGQTGQITFADTTQGVTATIVTGATTDAVTLLQNAGPVSFQATVGGNEFTVVYDRVETVTYSLLNSRTLEESEGGSTPSDCEE